MTYEEYMIASGNLRVTTNLTYPRVSVVGCLPPCPSCGWHVRAWSWESAVNMGDETMFAIEVKCRKCKFEGPVNLAYFRRQKRHGCCFITRTTRKPLR